jgi:Sec-independent protein translocase protein TatA
MITTAIFLLLLGLIVFGPKKTIEMAQSAGEMLGKVKQATGNLQRQLGEELQERENVPATLAGPVAGSEDVAIETKAE